MRYLLLAFLIGCSSGEHANPYQPESSIKARCSYETIITGKVNRLVEKHLKFFFDQAEPRIGRCYQVRDVDLETEKEVEDAVDNPYTIGYCSVSAYRRIAFSGDFWLAVPDTYKEIVMLHEMGHCALNLEHTEPGVNNLMTPRLGDVIDYEQNKAWFIDKLFNRSLD